MTTPAEQIQTTLTGDLLSPADVHRALKAASDQLAAVAARDARGAETAWLRDIQEATRSLFAALDKHARVAEHTGGTLPEATQMKPGLMAATERLEHEHADLLHRAAEIEHDAEGQLASGDLDVDLLQIEAQVLRDILLLHLVRTNALVYQAYFQVEGGEGG